MKNHINQLILFCRAGFEKECAGEIMSLAKRHRHPAYVQTDEGSGYVSLVSTAAPTDSAAPSASDSILELYASIPFAELIFTRQWFIACNTWLALPETNRLPAIIKQISHIITHLDVADVYDIELDYADTNDGKSLSKFCRQFKPHLIGALKKNRLLSAHSNWRLHLFFSDSQNVIIGLSALSNSDSRPMGIPRLKMPATAPSRSTLKLDEAIHWFLSEEQQRDLFRNGNTAVDLGAAPGGWSWQLVQRGCLVTAIDNGPMQHELMNSGMVDHLKRDAFTYTPEKKVDWLVCDMAERPLHVTRLIARWLTRRWCSNAIFNLKLPMKKRLASVEECLSHLQHQLDQTGITHTINAKHLYHDREEITVCVLCP